MGRTACSSRISNKTAQEGNSGLREALHSGTRDVSAVGQARNQQSWCSGVKVAEGVEGKWGGGWLRQEAEWQPGQEELSGAGWVARRNET